MDDNISLADLRALREQTADRLAELDDLIGRIERIKLGGQLWLTSEVPHDVPARTGTPRIWNALEAVLREHSGIPVARAIDQLLNRVESQAANKRKMFWTRISQFVKQGRVMKHDGGLYLPEQVR